MVFARVGATVYNGMTEAQLLEEAKKIVIKKRNKLVKIQLGRKGGGC